MKRFLLISLFFGLMSHTANANDAVKFQLAEYKCLWQEGFGTLEIIENMMEKEKENDTEFGLSLIHI